MTNIWLFYYFAGTGKNYWSFGGVKMTKTQRRVEGDADSLCELEASYRGMWDALNRKLPWRTIELWSMVSGFKKCRSDLTHISVEGY